MKSTKVASRYAKALLELAIEQNSVDQIVGDMNYLLSANQETSDFQLLLKSPIIKAEKKIAIFAVIFDQFEASTKSFIELITKNGRENFLPEIAEAYIAQVKEYKGIVPVTIVSAIALDENTRSSILSKIKTSIKGDLEVIEQIDPALIGGFVVRIGDKQIDASVSSQLNNLKQRLTR